MGLKQWVKLLERSADKDLDSFKLTDGSIYYYDPMEAYKALYLFCYDMELATESDVLPQPPEILQRICEAEDPPSALARFAPKNPQVAFVNLDEIYDTDILVRERRLVLRTA